MNHRKKIKVFVFIIVILAICIGGIACSLYDTYHSLKEDPMRAFAGEQPSKKAPGVAQSTDDSPLETITIEGNVYQKKKDVISILLLGIDADGSKEKAAARSDMIMLCTIDVEEGSITLTSIPRDTRALVHDGDKETGEILEKMYLTKINHAYILAGGNDPNKYGTQNAMLAVQELISCEGQLNLPIDYYISIDLEHLSDLAEVFDGVEVTLEQDIKEVGKKGDTVTLKGENVRYYLQNRKEQEDGEMDRQRHEQTFLIELAKKMKEMGAPKAAMNLFPKLTKDIIQTNLNMEQVMAMAGAVDQLSSMDDMRVEIFSETEGSWEWAEDPIVKSEKKLCYYVMDEDELRNKMLNLYYVQQ